MPMKSLVLWYALACVAFCQETDTSLGSSLSLQACFSLARHHNADLHKAWAKVEETKGEHVVTRSRLLPQLSLKFGAGIKQEVDSVLVDTTVMFDTSFSANRSLDLELRQRIIEFGATRPEEYDWLRRRRRVVYDQEGSLVDVLSAIRRTYFSLTIVRLQLSKHNELLAVYEGKYRQTQERLDKGVGLKSAVLTASLNRLEERERILGLQSRQREYLARLEELLGGEKVSRDVRLLTAISTIDFGEDSCVSFGIEQNTEIADARAEAELAKRKLRETGWEFAPGMSLAAGVAKNTSSAEVSLSNEHNDRRREWSVDLVGRQSLVEGTGDLASRDVFGDSFSKDGLRFTAKLAVDLPLFQGLRPWGRRKQEGARYEQARAEVLIKTRNMERRIRESFYNFELNREQLAIQEERVEIARERYRLAETLHEMGKISEDGYDSFRERLFGAQDRFFSQQFKTLDAEENLRATIRKLD